MKKEFEVKINDYEIDIIEPGLNGKEEITASFTFEYEGTENAGFVCENIVKSKQYKTIAGWKKAVNKIRNLGIDWSLYQNLGQ